MDIIGSLKGVKFDENFELKKGLKYAGSYGIFGTFWIPKIEKEKFIRFCEERKFVFKEIKYKVDLIYCFKMKTSEATMFFEYMRM
jgi:hypothetical protein